MKATLYFLLSFVLLGAAACSDSSGRDTLAATTSTFVDNAPGSCPSLTQDEKGAVVLSWVRKLNDTAAVFCYARSADGGRTFGKAVVVPGSDHIKPHSENLPKVIFKASGEMLAVWGAPSSNPKNKYSGNVYYNQSFDGGLSWEGVKPLVTDTAGYDQRYFDVALLKNGEAAIIWLDNRKSTEAEGSALYIASTQGTRGFRGERRIAQPCCQCCRTDLFIDRSGGVHALYRGIIQDSIRDMVHIVSTDGGQTFTQPKRIANDNWVLNACPHTGPAMTENTSGLHFAWYTGGQHKGSFYTRSTTNGAKFIQHDSITFAGKHPQLAATEAGELAIVWDEHHKVGNQFFTRIGLQQRTADGKSVKKEYLTADTVNASYPVVVPVKGQGLVVAYCQKKGDEQFVAFRSVKL